MKWRSCHTGKCLTMLVVLWLGVCGMVTRAATVEELYASFMQSRGNYQVNVANELMRALYKADSQDTLVVFANNQVSKMNSLVHYRMAEYYYSKSLYEKALEAGKRSEAAGKYYRDRNYHSDLNNILGVTQMQLGNFADAKSCFEHTIDELMETNQYNARQIRVQYWIIGILSFLLLSVLVLLYHLHRKNRPEATVEPAMAALPHTDDNGAQKMEAADRVLLGRIVDSIYSHMSKGVVDIASLSADLGMSASQLRSAIQRLTGETAATYVMRVRLSHAQRLLSHGDAPIGDIAQQCGFQTNAHFTRCFKQEYDVTPTQYRRMSINH